MRYYHRHDGQWPFGRDFEHMTMTVMSEFLSFRNGESSGRLRRPKKRVLWGPTCKSQMSIIRSADCDNWIVKNKADHVKGKRYMRGC